MGKRLIVQRRGRGGSNFRNPRHKRRGEVKHRFTKKGEDVTFGTIKELVHESGRGTPLARVKFADGREQWVLVPEGAFIGQRIEYGSKNG